MLTRRAVRRATPTAGAALRGPLAGDSCAGAPGFEAPIATAAALAKAIFERDNAGIDDERARLPIAYTLLTAAHCGMEK